MLDLKAKPFFLDEEDIKWVENTILDMSLEEKIGQLFLHFGTDDKELLKNNILPKNIGGMLYRPRKASEIHDLHTFIQNNSKIPLLIAGNIEDGGAGIATEGTLFAREMEVAAANNTIHAYHNGKVSCSEAASVGVNWAFGPVSDIDLNFRNPITNIKTYGSDPDRVLANSLEFMRGAKESGVAVAPKHFPGEGPDELDQHLVTVVNGLSCEEWDNTLGKVFKGMIEGGTLSLMIGHIALPSYQKYFNPDTQNQVIPATLSKEILTDLLRDKLGFNGVIVTDTTTIGGFRTAMTREKAIPLTVASGCDMVMYSLDFEEDLAFMKKGYDEGIITENRLNDAVKRILAMKASLNLHVKKELGALVPSLGEAYKILGNQTHKDWAKDCADAAITLVKDLQNILPISADKQKRILLEVVGDADNGERDTQIKEYFIKKLAEKGFDITFYNPYDPEFNINDLKIIKSNFDLVIYLGNIETKPNKTVSRITWYSTKEATNLPWFVHDIPTIFISLANPYNLIDAPMIKTYINCYANSDIVIDAVIEKIIGQSKFTGVSPIDPFCGRWDTRL